MAVFERILPAAALLVAVASSAGAQAAPAAAAPVCEASQASSGNSARANIMLQLALKDQKANPAVAAKNLLGTVKLLDNVDKADELNRSYVLGGALALWMNQPGTGLTPKRAAVGFASNPDATIDLPSAIDSLFKIVEASKPGCAYYTAYWRGGQQAYLDLVNGAINSLNSDKLDSAQYYATQANKMFSASPYGSMVLGNVANKRNNNVEAVKYWQLAATAAETDSAYRDVQRQMLGNIAGIHINAARDASSAKAAQVEAARKAVDVYSRLIAIPGTKGMYLASGRQNLQTALMITGDTAGAVKTYQDLLANSSAYEYQDLLNSAVSASRANRAADAAKLFEAVLQANPHNRDALFNLAVVYLSLQQNAKVGPIVTRLVALDPGNPENYLLAARAYVELGKQAKKGTPAAAALNDTTVTWYNKGSKLPVDVSFSEFTPSEKQVDLAGGVADRRDKAAGLDDGSTTTTIKGARAKATATKAAAKPTFPAKPITLKFEVLDKGGAVLGSQSVTTEALQPGKSANFRISIPAANAIAYRYTIVD